MTRVSHPSPQIASVHGMVSAAHPLAARAGVSIMEKGGNAFDAAVAVAAALNVVEPFMSGIAGVGYAILWIANEKRLRVLDFIPPVPRSFPVERFSQKTEMLRGVHSMAAPGNLAGWHELSRSYGRLSFGELLSPGIKFAQDGFALSEFGVRMFNESAPGLAALGKVSEELRRVFPCASEVKVGDLVVQPDLAETFRVIAREGIETFYEGSIAKRMIDHIAAMGGSFRSDDLRNPQVAWREPFSVQYRGLEIHVPPPPCEAFQFLLTLKILEPIDFAKIEQNGTEHLDLMIRATRLAARARIEHNDPTETDLATIFSPDYLATLQQELAEGGGAVGQTEQWSTASPPSRHAGHTTSFSVGDAEGNLVCITQSNGNVFGNGMIVPGTGICLNNFLYWADMQPASPNHTRPGVNLTGCLSPSISIFQGKPTLALGTPGGYGIMQTQAQAMVQLVDYHCSLRDAIMAPRMRLWDGNVVQVENRIPEQVVAELREKGHGVTTLGEGWSMQVGGMQAVSREASGLMIGVADPRRDGVAMPL